VQMNMGFLYFEWKSIFKNVLCYTDV